MQLGRGDSSSLDLEGNIGTDKSTDRAISIELLVPGMIDPDHPAVNRIRID